MDYALYETGQTVSSAGVTFQTEDSSLKMSLKVTEWVCKAPSNTLNVVLFLNTTPAATPPIGGPTPDTENPNIDMFVLDAGAMNTTIRLLKFAEVDGSNVNISFVFGQDNLLVLTFPCPSTSIVYDPDFSVLLTGGGDGGGDGGSNGSNGDGSSSSVNLTWLALIALVVIPIALIALVVLIVIAVVVIAHNKRAQVSTVAFGPDLD